MNIVNFIFLFLYIILYSIKRYSSIFSIFFSILILGIILICIFYRFKKTYTKKKIVASIMLSFVMTIFGFYTMMYSYQHRYINIKNISKKPITIEGIYLDSEKVRTNHSYEKKYDFIQNASLKTEYQLYNKNDQAYKMTLYPNEEYTINMDKVKHIEIDFQRNKEELTVLINQKKYSIPKYHYSISKKVNLISSSSFKYQEDNIKYSSSLIFSILYVVISFFLFFHLSLISLGRLKASLLLLLMIMIEFNPIIHLTFLTKAIILFFVLFFLNKVKMLDEDIHKNKVSRIVLSGVISFSFLGEKLITHRINLLLFLLFAIFVLFFYLFIPYLYSYLDSRCQTLVSKKNQNSSFKHRIVLFFLILMILGFYGYFFYPYILHVDGLMELSDISKQVLNNWHPYFHTFILQLVNQTFGEIHYFIYLRYLLYAFFLTTLLFYFHQKGLSLSKVYFLAILFTAFPLTGVMLSTLIKDIDFILFFVILSFYLYLLIYDYAYFNRHRINYLILLISLVLVGCFRHNGIYISIIVLLYLIIYNMKVRNIFLLVITFLSISFIFIIKVPLYNYLSVGDAPVNFDIMPMIHGIDYLMVQDKKIDSDLYQYLTHNVLSKNEFIYCYDRYNIDLLLHYSGKDIRNTDYDKKKIVIGYMKQFFITPLSLIKDRLYGTDLIWNNSEIDQKEVYKFQIQYDEFETSYIEKTKPKAKYHQKFSKVICDSLVAIANCEILNLLFFRAGIYFDFVLLLAVYSIINKKKNLVFLLPFFLNIFTLFIAMGHQEYRYVWFIPLISCIYYLLIIYKKT